MPLAKPLERYESVETWAKGLRDQWGEDSEGPGEQKLRTLEAFCRFVGKDPDALVAFCFLRRRATGERFGSVQRRAQITESIAAFRAASGLPPQEARCLQSEVLSFLIHNGVLIQMGIG